MSRKSVGRACFWISFTKGGSAPPPQGRPVRRLRSPPSESRPFSAVQQRVEQRQRPVLDSGELPFPHLGDWTQDGQPASHSHAAIGLPGGGQPVAGGREAALGETRRRPRGRRTRRRSAARWPGAGRSRPRRCPSGRRWRTAAAGRSRRARPRAPRRAGPAPAHGQPSACRREIVHHMARVAACAAAGPAVLAERPAGRRTPRRMNTSPAGSPRRRRSTPRPRPSSSAAAFPITSTSVTCRAT